MLIKKGKKSRLLDVDQLDTGEWCATFLLVDALSPRLARITLEDHATNTLSAQLKYIEEAGKSRTNVYGCIADIRCARLVDENDGILRPERGDDGEIRWRTERIHNTKSIVNRNKGIEIRWNRTTFPVIPFERLDIAAPNNLDLKPSIESQAIDPKRDIHVVHAHVLKTRGMNDEVTEAGFILDLNRAIDAFDVVRVRRILDAGLVRSDSSLFSWERHGSFSRPMYNLVAKIDALAREEKTDARLRKARTALSMLELLAQSSFLNDLGVIGAILSCEDFKTAYRHVRGVIEKQQLDRQQQIDALNANCFIGYLQTDRINADDALVRYRFLRDHGWLPAWEELRNTVRHPNAVPLLQAMLSDMDVTHPPAFNNRWESPLYQAATYHHDDNAAALIESGFPCEERDVHDIMGDARLPKTRALLEYRLLKEKAAEVGPGLARIKRSAI